jgi:hypothetical protein
MPRVDGHRREHLGPVAVSPSRPQQQPKLQRDLGAAALAPFSASYTAQSKAATPHRPELPPREEGCRWRGRRVAGGGDGSRFHASAPFGVT